MKERYYFIDWLRIIAIILVLFFHVGMMFKTDTDWHIRNNQTSNLVLEFTYWLSLFRMPLLFFISGAGAYWALRKRTAWKFLKERHNRLMIPLLFSMLVIVPPQVFFERLFSGQFTGNFFQFWPSIFTTGPYPEGNMSWHHMWFVLYLFFYSAILLPLFLFLRKKNVQEKLGKIKWLNNPIGIFALILPTIIMFIFWSSTQARTNALVNDWGYFPYWMSFFLVGYFMSVSGKYWQILEEKRKLFLKLAVLCMVLLNYFRWNDLEPWGLYGEGWRSHLFSNFYLMLIPANAWLWLLAAVGYGKKYLNKNHRVLAYANRGIYPFYILHQTIIICIGFYVTNLEDSILSKYIFVATISFILTVAIYDFLIRPYRIMRFLFGVKEIPKKSVQLDKNNGHKIEKIVKDDILFVESMQNYIHIQCSEQKYTAHQSLKSVKAHLENDGFIQPHKSYLVPVKKIQTVDGNSLIIGKYSVPISKYLKEEVLKMIVDPYYLKKSKRLT